MTARAFSVALLLCLAATASVAIEPIHADVYADIDDHIQNNRLSEARSLIRATLNDDTRNPRLYLQLSAILEYQSDHREAIEVLRSGMNTAIESHELFHYNIGNNHIALRQYSEAESAYSRALAIDAAYHHAYLNRANTRVQRENYVGAIEDYTQYLDLTPSGEYSADVTRMIAVLRDLLQAEEDRERERLLREKRLLDEALLLLEGAHNEGLTTRAPSADIDELETELDIVE